MKSHPMRARDYTEHMLDAAQAIQQFIVGMNEEEFTSDRRTRDAVVRNIEIVGEAANNLSNAVPNAAERFPAIKLRAMYAMRNRMSHAYAFVNFSVVYEIAVRDIPPAIEALEALLANWPPDLT